MSTGYFIPDPGLWYRKWPGQRIGSAAHSEPAERDARMNIIEARARALLDRQTNRNNVLTGRPMTRACTARDTAVASTTPIGCSLCLTGE